MLFVAFISILSRFRCLFFFFFNDTATTEIYTLSLHDALPICAPRASPSRWWWSPTTSPWRRADRKSTRLNSSHVESSYAVFCLKKKKKESDKKFRVGIKRNKSTNTNNLTTG